MIMTSVSTPFSCFFFQAEDGIRCLTVTGVQTCALPIFTICERLVQMVMDALTVSSGPQYEAWATKYRRDSDAARSEERRVGKECGSPAGADVEVDKEGELQCHRLSQPPDHERVQSYHVI